MSSFSDVKIINEAQKIAWCGELNLKYVKGMNEKILKMIEEYKRREKFMTEVIAELEKEDLPKDEIVLKLARNTRVLWRVVIKDLENILR